MPPKKTKSSKRVATGKVTVAGHQTAAKQFGLSMPEKLLIIISMLAIFMIGLVMTDTMSKAMASVIVSSYQRQASMGSSYNQPNGYDIQTGFATSTFASVAGSYVKSTIHLPIGNVLSYQLFNANTSNGALNPATASSEITAIDSYGCTNRLRALTLYDNEIEIVCGATTASPVIPNVGDIAMARYYYISGQEPVYNWPPTDHVGAVTVQTGNNPRPGLIRAGATGVTFGYVKFSSIYDSLDLDQLTMYVDDGGISGTATGNYQDLTKVYIYDRDVSIASSAIPSTGKFTWTFSNGTLTIPQDAEKTLTIKADVGTISANSDNAPATPAADIRLGFGGVNGFKFTGNGSGVIADETYNGSTTSAMVLHKAMPSVTVAAASPSFNNGPVNLLNYTITAEGNSVLLYRNSFEINAGGGTDTVVSNCSLKDSNGNVIGSVTTPTNLSQGQNFVTFTFNNPNISVGDDKEAIEIPQASSKTFTLSCNIANAGPGDYLATALLGDNASSMSATSLGTPSDIGQNIADAWTVENQGNFVLSDNFKNRGLDTDGANATAYGQWYNGHLVAGLQVPPNQVIAIGWNESGSTSNNQVAPVAPKKNIIEKIFGL